MTHPDPSILKRALMAHGRSILEHYPVTDGATICDRFPETLFQQTSTCKDPVALDDMLKIFDMEADTLCRYIATDVCGGHDGHLTYVGNINHVGPLAKMLGYDETITSGHPLEGLATAMKAGMEKKYAEFYPTPQATIDAGTTVVAGAAKSAKLR